MIYTRQWLINLTSLASTGLKISPSGKKIMYKHYNIKFVVSKYGYDDYFGLSFFIRAENLLAKKDEYGNIDAFEEGSLIDFKPYTLFTLKKGGKNLLREIYNDNKQLLSLDNYFCATNTTMLDKLVNFTLPCFIQYIEGAAQG